MFQYTSIGYEFYIYINVCAYIHFILDLYRHSLVLVLLNSFKFSVTAGFDCKSVFSMLWLSIRIFFQFKKKNLCNTTLKLINWSQGIIITTCDSNNCAFRTVHAAFRGLSWSVLGRWERFGFPVAIAEVCLSWQGLCLSFDRKLGDACLQPYRRGAPACWKCIFL